MCRMSSAKRQNPLGWRQTLQALSWSILQPCPCLLKTPFYRSRFKYITSVYYAMCEPSDASDLSIHHRWFQVGFSNLTSAERFASLTAGSQASGDNISLQTQAPPVINRTSLGFSRIIIVMVQCHWAYYDLSHGLKVSWSNWVNIPLVYHVSFTMCRCLQMACPPCLVACEFSQQLYSLCFYCHRIQLYWIYLYRLRSIFLPSRHGGIRSSKSPWTLSDLQ